MSDTIDEATIRRVLGGFATGVDVAITAGADEPHGMTVNSLTVVAASSLGFVDCSLETVHGGGGHDIAVGSMCRREERDGGPPLLYRGRLGPPAAVTQLLRQDGGDQERRE